MWEGAANPPHRIFSAVRFSIADSTKCDNTVPPRDGKIIWGSSCRFSTGSRAEEATKFWENLQKKPLDFEKCVFLNQNSHFLGGQEGCRHPKKTHFCGGPQNLGGVATKCSGSPFCVQGVKGLHYPPRLAPAHVTRGRRLSAVGGRGVQKLESKEQMPWTLTWQ